MANKPRYSHIAYRCPDCGTMTVGLVGDFSINPNLLRLKCACGGSALDISYTQDKKLKLSIPCLFCKQNHNFIVSDTIFFEKDLFVLNCPYAGMDIGFIGTKEAIDNASLENEKNLKKLISEMGAESLEDIQPIDLEEEDELPEASVYDTIRFLVKDLEYDNKITCPCNNDVYETRYAKGGIECYCPECGAKYLFKCTSPAATEEYLNLDSLELK